MTDSTEISMPKEAKIYVAGHRGLAGSAILRRLLACGYRHVITRTRDQLDLTDPAATEAFFSRQRPDYVFLAAARVGGIHANQRYPAEFIHQNLTIQNHVIHQSYLKGVKRLVFLGSSCSYPKYTAQPIREDQLMTGALEPTNSAYAVAKIAGIEMCWAYNRQYGTRFVPVMPTNLYGPRDNFDLQNSHVLPALIRKFHLGKLAMNRHWQAIVKDENRYGPIPETFKRSLGFDPEAEQPGAGGEPAVLLWGTGQPRREFLYADDLADACLFLLFHPWQALTVPSRGTGGILFNIGSGTEGAIHRLAAITAEVVGYKGTIRWDDSMPDGTPCKLLDTTRLTQLGWQPQSRLADGIRSTYQWYLDHY